MVEQVVAVGEVVGCRPLRYLGLRVDRAEGEPAGGLNPVAIGTGVPLFDGEFAPQRFRLADSRAFESGVIFLTYVRR
ncbi:MULTISPECIES: hypothetical protein [unclassified Rhodococcus (in: high G+C Gram-positive bacteria)]|uniref:hypothetical protein n=1 Tax=unclassified Rhodococcus (in: high G+C Gram-positive bacteria) TaxID=192944 RepID=UPI002078B4A7|nr:MULTISPECIES: hypothetical protein [unclassified Rhodococcus (in: high G+C Gram-positive bacteria)]